LGYSLKESKLLVPLNVKGLPTTTSEAARKRKDVQVLYQTERGKNTMIIVLDVAVASLEHVLSIQSINQDYLTKL
jgi:hypothetical protein